MVAICASHKDSLIVYEHYDESGGGRSIYCEFQLHTTLTRLLQGAVKHGYTPDSSKGQINLGIRLYRTVAIKEVLIYMSIDKLSCAF